MKLANLFLLIKVLKYIKIHPNCVSPDIRDSLQISHSEPPTQEEKDIYKIISTLQREGYVQKNPIKQRELGGPHFTVALTDSGVAFLNNIGLSGEEMVQEKIYADFKSELRIALLKELRDTSIISRGQKPEFRHALNEALETLKSSYLLRKKK